MNQNVHRSYNKSMIFKMLKTKDLMLRNKYKETKIGSMQS